jgi:hypothetical protein
MEAKAIGEVSGEVVQPFGCAVGMCIRAEEGEVEVPEDDQIGGVNGAGVGLKGGEDLRKKGAPFGGGLSWGVED